MTRYQVVYILAFAASLAIVGAAAWAEKRRCAWANRTALPEES